MSEQTYWNGEPTPCRRVRVIVGESEKPTWWCAGLEGTVRRVVEVSYFEEPFYLDNEEGQGWWKVTAGGGGPDCGHAGLPVKKVLEEMV